MASYDEYLRKLALEQALPTGDPAQKQTQDMGMSAGGSWGTLSPVRGGGVQYQMDLPTTQAQSAGGASFQTTDYEKLYANIGNARKMALDSALLNQQQQLAGQQNALQGQYNDVRNQAYTNARVSALGNNERLAAQGLAGSANAGPQSGYSETSRVAQDTALGNALNAATRQQQAASDALTQQGNTAMLNRDQQLASTTADLEGQKANAISQQNQFAANFGLQKDQFTEQQKQNAQNQANWQSQFDYSKGRDAVSDEQWNKTFGMQMDQAQKQQSQQALDNAWNRANTLGYIDEQASAVLGIPAGTKTEAARQWQDTFDYNKAQAAKSGGGGKGNNSSTFADLLKAQGLMIDANGNIVPITQPSTPAKGGSSAKTFMKAY